MNIKIVTPTEQEDEKIKLLRRAVELIKRQARSANRYAVKIQNLLNKASKL